jgi:hypothetical protein
MKAKNAGLVTMVYGAVGCGFGLFALLITYVENKMIVNFKSTDQLEKMKIYFHALQNVWLIFMPLMILIGLIYLLSGYYLKKQRKEGISVGIVATILNILWFIGYVMSLITNVMPVFPHRIDPAVEISIFSLVGIITCLYPIYFLFIFKRIELGEV